MNIWELCCNYTLHSLAKWLHFLKHSWKMTRGWNCSSFLLTIRIDYSSINCKKIRVQRTGSLIPHLTFFIGMSDSNHSKCFFWVIMQLTSSLPKAVNRVVALLPTNKWNQQSSVLHSASVVFVASISHPNLCWITIKWITQRFHAQL